MDDFNMDRLIIRASRAPASVSSEDLFEAYTSEDTGLPASDVFLAIAAGRLLAEYAADKDDREERRDR